jgi:predicted RND superfamily exporter protein
VTRIWHRLAALQVRRAASVVLVFAVLALVGGWRASRLQLVTDFSDLLPQDQPSVLELRHILARTRGLSNVYIVLEGPDASSLRRAADLLVPRLLAIGGPYVESASSGVQEARRFLLPRAGLFLSEEDLGELEDRLADQERQAYRAAIGADLDDGEKASPTKLGDDIERRLSAKVGGLRRFPDGYFQGPGPRGTAQLIVVKSAVAAGDLRPATETQARVSEVVSRTLAENKQALGDVQVAYAGDLLTSKAEYELVRDDVLGVGGVGLGLVLAVVVLFFRSLRVLGLLGAAIGVGCAVTFGLTDLVLGHLNVATAFLFSIVAGNGVNFSIIWLSRFLEERRTERSLAEVLTATAERTFGATLTAACAAAAAYAALGVGHFRGFRHFAFIGGTGMLICWAVTYLFLPALVALTQPAGRPRPDRAIEGTPFTRFERPALHLVEHAPGATLVAGLIVTCAAVLLGSAYLRRGPLEYDMHRLQSDREATSELYRVSHLADRIRGAGEGSGMVVLTSDARDTPVLAETLRRLRDRAPAGEKPFEQVHTLDDLVPPRQTERLVRLQELARRLRRDRARGAIDDDLWGRIERLLPTADTRPFGMNDLPKDLAAPFTEKDGTRGRILFIEPTAGQSDSDLHYLLRWADAFRRTELPNGHVVHGSGRAVIFADLLHASLVDMPRSILLSFLLTATTVVLLFRRGLPASLVVGSLAVALVWMLGALGAADVRLSFINFIALPITFGIGIDYPVNIYGRFDQNPRAGILAALRGAGGPVILCSLTTSLGYLALLRAHNQAVRSLGAVAVLGEVTCLAVAVIILPSAIAWKQNRDDRVEGASGQRFRAT